MMRLTSLSEVHAAIGQELGVSSWRAITQDDVDRFADATDDHQWIHAAGERADAGPFGGPIVHGLFTLSLLPALVREVLDLSAFAATINYGFDRVRLPAPLPVGLAVRGRVLILDAVETALGLRLTTQVTVEAVGVAKPVCVAEQVRLLVS